MNGAAARDAQEQPAADRVGGAQPAATDGAAAVADALTDRVLDELDRRGGRFLGLLR